MKKIIAVLATLLMAIVLSSCESGNNTSQSRQQGQAQTQQAYKQQSDAVPYPVSDLTDSLERRNLKERLLRQNEADRIGYVYFVSFGKFLGYWTIKGKVSSTQSQMTPSDEMTGDVSNCSGCSEHVVLEAPGDDGSFGQNEPGVFFFTTDDVMVQLPEDAYVYSDQPIVVGNIPELKTAPK